MAASGRSSVEAARRIRISEPVITDEDIRVVIDVLRSGWIAGKGPWVRKLEEAFAKYVGVKHAVAVANGTLALYAALYAAGVREGDEVIVPCFTFIATANAVLALGARPVFADIELETYNIDPDSVLELITSRTKAIIAVHLYGHMADVKALKEIAEDHKLLLIEDAAQAHGAEYRGVKAGAWGDVAAFSFYATKNMTSGEGGIITTNDDRIAYIARMLRDHGQEGRYHHVTFGLNLRLSSILAALAYSQLKRLDEMNEARRRNARLLTSLLSGTKLVTPVEKPGFKHVYHQYVVRVEKDEVGVDRDTLAERLSRRGVETAVHYPAPIPDQPYYRALGYPPSEAICPNALKASREVLSLPVHPKLTRTDIEYIASSVKEALNEG